MQFICVKTGIIFKMRSTPSLHVSVPNIYGTSSSTHLIIIFEGDIKGFVFQHNSEAYKFISAAVDIYWDSQRDSRVAVAATTRARL